MKPKLLLTLLLLLLALLLAPSAPLLAQGEEEGDEEEQTNGRLFVEVGSWIGQPTGLELEPATRLDPSDPFGTQPIRFTDQTDTEIYFLVGYELPGDNGRVVAWLYDHEQDDWAMTESTPSNFGFGETMVNPLFAGVSLNGLADAFDATATVSLTDLRLDYYRTAFESPRIKADWFVGWRRVKFSRAMNVNYYALVPDFPALLPPLTEPLPALVPQVDNANTLSQFEGRGLEAGFEFKVPLAGDRFTFEAGMAFAALRGDTNARYASTVWVYTLDGSEIGEDPVTVVLSPPYSEFGETIIINPLTGERAALARFVDQSRFRSGIETVGRSTTAAVIDVNVALRYRFWQDFELVIGFRDTHYANVITDLRTKTAVTPLGTTNTILVTTNANGDILDFTSPGLIVNVQDSSEDDRSVTFEGFYFGLAYKF